MSQSKIQALKNSPRKSAVKQEILPHIQPLIKPTRDRSIQNRTSSLNLNLKQQAAADIVSYQRRVQQLQRQLQDYEFEHQANLVYIKQYKMLGKLFGNQNLQFQQIRHKIQDLILNANQMTSNFTQNTTYVTNKPNRLANSKEDQNLSQQILSYSKQQLKDKLIQATRSQFLNILQLGSAILLENQTADQRKRKAVRQMFYQIWKEILVNFQDSASKLHHIQLRQVQNNNDYYNSISRSRAQQKTEGFQTQLLQKNKYISQLAQQLQKVTNLLSQKSSKINFYKDNYQLIQKQCQSLTSQNTDLIQQSMRLKRELMNYQDRLRDYQDKENDTYRRNSDNQHQIRILKEELADVKHNKEKQCKEMINRIDQLMLSVNRYDATISDLQTQKNQLLREIWVYKANIEDLSNKLKHMQKDYLKEKQRYAQLQESIKYSKQKSKSSQQQTYQRIQQLNQQLLNLRQQNEEKQRQYQGKLQKLKRQLRQKEAQLEDLTRQNQMLKDRGTGDSEPHTAVFGGLIGGIGSRGNKLSEQLKTSIIDERVGQLQQNLRRARQSSHNQIAELQSSIMLLRNTLQQTQQNKRQLQRNLQNLKQNNLEQLSAISNYKDQIEKMNREKSIMQGQIAAYKQRIRQLESILYNHQINKDDLRMEYEQKYNQIRYQNQIQTRSIGTSDPRIPTNINIPSANNQNYSQTIKKLTTQIRQKQQEIENLRRQRHKSLNSFTNINIISESENQMVLNKENLIQKVANYQKVIKQFENKLARYTDSEQVFKNQMRNMEDKYSRDISSLQTLLDNNKKQLQLRIQNIRQLQSQIVELETKLNSQQNSHSQKYKSLNNLLAERNKIINQLNVKIQHLNQQQQSRNRMDQSNLHTSKSIQIDQSPIPTVVYGARSAQTLSMQQIKQMQNIKNANKNLLKQAELYEIENKKLNLEVQEFMLRITQLQSIIKQMEMRLKEYAQRFSGMGELKREQGVGSYNYVTMSSKSISPSKQKISDQYKQSVQKYRQYVAQLENLLKQKQNLILALQKQQVLSQPKQMSLSNSYLPQATIGVGTPTSSQLEQFKVLTKQWEEKLATLQGKLSQSSQVIQKKDLYIAEITNTLSGQAEHIKKLSQQVAKMQKQFKPLAQAHAKLDSEHQQIVQILKSTQTQLSQAKAYTQSLQQQCQNLKQLNQSLRGQNLSLKQINQRIKQSNEQLSAAKRGLQQQIYQLNNVVHELEEHLAKLSNIKLDSSFNNGKYNLTTNIESENNQNSTVRLYNKYGSSGPDNRNELRTIKQVINSQNQLQQQNNPDHSIINIPNNNVNVNTNTYSNTTRQYNSQRLLTNQANQQDSGYRRQSLPNYYQMHNTGQHVDLRQNQAYKTAQQYAYQRKDGGQSNRLATRPSIQKNSTKYQALLKQSYEMELPHQGANTNIGTDSNGGLSTKNGNNYNNNNTSKAINRQQSSQKNIAISSNSSPSKNGSQASILGTDKKQETINRNIVNNSSNRQAVNYDSNTIIDSINRISNEDIRTNNNININSNTNINSSTKNIAPNQNNVEGVTDNNSMSSARFVQPFSESSASFNNNTQNNMGSGRQKPLEVQNSQQLNKQYQQQAKDIVHSIINRNINNNRQTHRYSQQYEPSTQPFQTQTYSNKSLPSQHHNNIGQINFSSSSIEQSRAQGQQSGASSHNQIEKQGEPEHNEGELLQQLQSLSHQYIRQMQNLQQSREHIQPSQYSVLHTQLMTQYLSSQKQIEALSQQMLSKHSISQEDYRNITTENKNNMEKIIALVQSTHNQGTNAMDNELLSQALLAYGTGSGQGNSIKTIDTLAIINEQLNRLQKPIIQQQQLPQPPNSISNQQSRRTISNNQSHNNTVTNSSNNITQKQVLNNNGPYMPIQQISNSQQNIAIQPRETNNQALGYNTDKNLNINDNSYFPFSKMINNNINNVSDTSRNSTNQIALTNQTIMDQNTHRTQTYLPNTSSRIIKLDYNSAQNVTYNYPNQTYDNYGPSYNASQASNNTIFNTNGNAVNNNRYFNGSNQTIQQSNTNIGKSVSSVDKKQESSSMSKIIMESGTHIPINVYSSRPSDSSHLSASLPQQGAQLPQTSRQSIEQSQDMISSFNKQPQSPQTPKSQPLKPEVIEQRPLQQSKNQINNQDSINQIEVKEREQNKGTIYMTSQNKNEIKKLDDGSKSVVSEHEASPQAQQNIQHHYLPIQMINSNNRLMQNSNIVSQKHITQPQVVPSPPLPPSPITNMQNFGPNVVQATSQNTFRQITNNNVSNYSGTSKQASINKQIQQSNQNMSMRSNEQARVVYNMPYQPAAVRTQNILHYNNRSQVVYGPTSQPQIQQYNNRNNLQYQNNRYPSPSKVVISQRIDKIGFERLQAEIVPISQNQSLASQLQRQLTERQQIKNVFAQPNSSSNQRLAPIISQPIIIGSQRSISPPLVSDRNISNRVVLIGQPMNISTVTQSNLSPPHERKSVINSAYGSIANRKMFQTFNPHQNNRMSIYTKLALQRSQSPQSRSSSPPLPSNNINIPVSQIPSQISIPNLHVNNSAIVVLQQKNTHKRTQSLQPKIIHPISNQNSRIMLNKVNPVSQPVSNHLLVSNATVQPATKGSLSNVGPAIHQSSHVVSNKIISPQIVVSSPYGLDKTQPIKFNSAFAKNKNLQTTINRYSSRPITHDTRVTQLVTGPSNISQPAAITNTNRHTLNQDYFNNANNNASTMTNKQQQLQQVFGSKHKIIDGLSQSSSSGIDVQQKSTFGQCCPNC